MKPSTYVLLVPVAALIGCTLKYHDPARIDEAQRTGVCSTHHIRMNQEWSQVVYGLIPRPEGAVYETQQIQFPFAHRLIWGGPIRMTVESRPDLSDPDVKYVYVCTRCDTAKSEWIARNPASPWAEIWRAKEPNKAPEPTPTSVTPPANVPKIE